MTAPERGSDSASGESVDGGHDEPTAAVGERPFGLAMVWTVLGTLMPGLGLWRAGRRTVGALIMGVFAALLLAAGYLAAAPREQALTYVTRVDVLNGAVVGLAVLALGWVVVIATSHLALRPAKPSRAQRLAGSVLVGVLALAVATPLAVGSAYAHSIAQVLGTVFADDQPTPGAPADADPWADKPRINVLVIGGDSGTNRDTSLGLRADAVMMASIDTRTGVSTLFSLPRQTARIPFPKDSPLYRYYPNGFYDGVNGANGEYFLNAMYLNVPRRIPRNLLGDQVKNVGAEVMKIGVGEALGLGKADYYVIINMDGFKEFINALNGITLNVNYRIPIGGKTTERVPPKGWIEPGPNQHLNGRLALWYARGRYGVTGADYSRMERQRCVINAVVEQAKPDVVLTNFEKLATAGSKTIQTDIPRGLLRHLIPLAMKVKGTHLHSVVFQPGVAGWVSANPPWPSVQRRVQQALREADDAEAGPRPSPLPSGTASPSVGPKPTKKPAPKSENLSDTCAYHPQK